MNKWEKEVQQSLLNDEQQVLNILKTAYAGTLRDVQDKMSAYFARIQANPNDVSAIYQFRYQQALQDQIYNILDNLKNQNYQTISEYLEHSYENGWLGAMYDIHRQGIPVITPINQENAVRAITINSKISVPMYTRLGTDIDRLRVSIAAEVTRGIVSGSTWHDTAARISGQANISAYNAMRIARTEGHRVQCNAQYDACNSAKQSGADVVNQWDSTMDSRTRDTHRRLHKQLREVGQPFEIDGKKALYPGAFGIPEEDIHCRCALLQRARWALSEQELQQLRNTPEAKALAETSDFEEFKSKYLEITENSANSLTNSGENGTINYAKPIEMLNFSNVTSSGDITPENVIEELNRTAIGREILEVIETLPEPINFTYGEYATGIRGEEDNGAITIYLNNCRNLLWVARSVIHECTHYRYGIGQSQWAESVCIAQELKHARNRDYLTNEELRIIVQAVKQAYPEYNWRKGGIENGRRKTW